ncbi:MAG: NPCBM/NEW2 domain-containing protein [Pirellulales bacterium]|nr:NPCBM/NEW2 domain-containing protein [Pirellulales bacterium]
MKKPPVVRVARLGRQLLGIALVCGVAATGGAAETVPLSSLDLGKIRQGYGQPQAKKSIIGAPLSLGGEVFAEGVGTHAESTFFVRLRGGTERLTAKVGVDDGRKGHGGSVEFRVYGDGKLLYKSGVMKPGDDPKPVDVDLRGVELALLKVTGAGDGIAHDHADWADAVFHVLGARPEAADVPAEPAVILTPQPPLEPRINGPRIFGVRPGSPFLYTVPATGERPMTFAVENLPEGLKVDPETGQITGALKTPGEYEVAFKATNVNGSAKRKFKIVCGDTLALTPHMGWNSWYVWDIRVSDKIMREAAEAMVETDMINHGYQYVNIDDCWAVRPGANDPKLDGPPRDAQGKINANKRFPDMKALTDYIHRLGLKAGIYTSPGRLTCAGFTGALRHEKLDAERFAEWGFDFLKYDWCYYNEEAKDKSLAEYQKPYRLMGGILKQQKRDIVLNICQYGMGDVWKWGKEVGGHSWRTAGDLGHDVAGSLFRDGFDLYSQRELHKYGGPGGWNDPDYLLIGYLSSSFSKSADEKTGYTSLTPNEQYTHVSLWCLVAAPLIFSGDVTRLDKFTANLLMNDEVLDVDQDPLGRPGRRMAKDGDLEVWAKDMEDGSKAVGLFNRGEMEARVTAKWSDLGLSGKQRVRDLWRQKDLGEFPDSFSAPVGRHGVVLLRVWPAEE